MLKRGNIPASNSPDILVHSEKGYEVEAIKYTSNLSQAHILGENSVFETEEQALEYARARGFKKLVIVGEEIRSINV